MSQVAPRGAPRAAAILSRLRCYRPGLGAIAAALLLGVASPAAAARFDLSGGGDFGATGTMGGSDCTVSSPASCLSSTDSASGLTLTLSAWTLIPDGQDALTGQTGVVFIDALGAGVKATPSSGSKAISGGGGHQDEALQFVLSMPVISSSVMITLTEFGGGESSEEDKASQKSSSKSSTKSSSKSSTKNEGDRAVVYIDSLTAPTIGAQIILDALIPVTGEAGTFMLDFADLDPSLLPDTLLSLSIRATSGHFLVTSFEATPVPESTTAALLGLGLVGIGWTRGVRRRRCGAVSSRRPCRPAAPRAAAVPRR